MVDNLSSSFRQIHFYTPNEFLSIHVAPKYQAFFTSTRRRIWLWKADFSILNCSSISRSASWLSDSIKVLLSSPSTSLGRPERGLSLSEKSPELNLTIWICQRRLIEKSLISYGVALHFITKHFSQIFHEIHWSSWRCFFLLSYKMIRFD